MHFILFLCSPQFGIVNLPQSSGPDPIEQQSLLHKYLYISIENINISNINVMYNCMQSEVMLFFQTKRVCLGEGDPSDPLLQAGAQMTGYPHLTTHHCSQSAAFVVFQPQFTCSPTHYSSPESGAAGLHVCYPFNSIYCSGLWLTTTLACSGRLPDTIT